MKGRSLSKTRQGGGEMCGIPTRSKWRDEVGRWSHYLPQGESSWSLSPLRCYLSYLFGSSEIFTSLWETMCSPNEDLRAVFLSCSWQMYERRGEKNCTTWYLARANPHPAPMWTEHQRPTHQHVRPIYNPAHGAPWNSPERELGNTLTRMILSSDNSWRSLRKTPPQMAPKRSNKVQSGSFMLTQPINKWKRLEHQLSYSTNTHLSVCLTTFTSPGELISTLKSLMHYSFIPILLMRSLLLAARLHS